MDEKEVRIIYEDKKGSVAFNEKEPNGLLDFLNKIVPEFKKELWKPVISSNGEQNYCIDVARMEDDVYTSSCYTVLVRKGYIYRVYDNTIPFCNYPSFRTGTSEKDIENFLEKIRTTLENEGYIDIDSFHYNYYDVKRDRASVVFITECKFYNEESGETFPFKQMNELT